jgi:hypothetical protein
MVFLVLDVNYLSITLAGHLKLSISQKIAMYSKKSSFKYRSDCVHGDETPKESWHICIDFSRFASKDDFHWQTRRVKDSQRILCNDYRLDKIEESHIQHIEASGSPSG